MAEAYGTLPHELMRLDWLDYQFNEYVWLVGNRAEQMLAAEEYNETTKKVYKKYSLHEALDMPKPEAEMMDGDAAYIQLIQLFGGSAKV